MWQEIAIVLIGAATVGYVACRVRRMFHKPADLSHCTHCDLECPLKNLHRKTSANCEKNNPKHSIC
ncbi:MAG: hypothetical protein LBR49_00345 [Tannerella sp.]|jgi:hypothetical protein|nr:hypothetical protein [Tannerella sp.]